MLTCKISVVTGGFMLLFQYLRSYHVMPSNAQNDCIFLQLHLNVIWQAQGTSPHPVTLPIKGKAVIDLSIDVKHHNHQS